MCPVDTGGLYISGYPWDIARRYGVDTERMVFGQQRDLLDDGDE
jgi:hypothetical protein